jgi:hypothetical protein
MSLVTSIIPTINTNNKNNIYTFIISDTVTFTQSCTIDLLVIGGGGGGYFGSTSNSSVGGAGGFIQKNKLTVPAGTYTIKVGAAGSSSKNGGTSSFESTNSEFTTVSAGGGQGDYNSDTPGGSCGGSGCSYKNGDTYSNGPAGTSTESNNNNVIISNNAGAGTSSTSLMGGGAGQAGAGKSSNITGANVFYSSGGNYIPGTDYGAGGGSTIDNPVKPGVVIISLYPDPNMTTMPITTVPMTTVPMTTVPSTTSPVTTIPTTVPMTTVPMTTVPMTTVPMTTMPCVAKPSFGIPETNTRKIASYIANQNDYLQGSQQYIDRALLERDHIDQMNESYRKRVLEYIKMIIIVCIVLFFLYFIRVLDENEWLPTGSLELLAISIISVGCIGEYMIYFGIPSVYIGIVSRSLTNFDQIIYQGPAVSNSEIYASDQRNPTPTSNSSSFSRSISTCTPPSLKN